MQRPFAFQFERLAWVTSSIQRTSRSDKQFTPWPTTMSNRDLARRFTVPATP